MKKYKIHVKETSLEGDGYKVCNRCGKMTVHKFSNVCTNCGENKNIKPKRQEL